MTALNLETNTVLARDFESSVPPAPGSDDETQTVASATDNFPQ